MFNGWVEEGHKRGAEHGSLYTPSMRCRHTMLRVRISEKAQKSVQATWVNEALPIRHVLIGRKTGQKEGVW
jgi:hypothetical protein